jgi:arylsulfatase A
VFTNFVVAPACSPARASLLTGRQHLLTGTWGVGPRANLLRDEVRMPRYFQASGYATGYFGKRDSIHWLELDPWALGCDEFEGVWGYDHLDPRMFTRAGVVEKKGWTCEIDVENALDFIKRHRDKPWWCAVAFILPHLPWEPSPRFAQPYLDAGCSESLAACYGSISQMDDATGRLLWGLEKLGCADDTIVVFLSDNGPSYKELTDEEAQQRNSLGLQGSKASAWENGIRVPLMVRWPQRFPPGPRAQFATVEDLLPTLVELTGLDSETLPPHPPWHGVSLRPILEHPDTPETDRTVLRVAIAGEGAVGGRQPFVSEPASLTMSQQHVTLRGPRFKLHQFVGGKTALFDLDADPGERRDIQDRFPDIARRYAETLQERYQQIVSSGRALRMPVVHVGPLGNGRNAIDGVMAHRCTGKVSGAGRGLRGFLQSGDSVEYAIDVQVAGDYEVTITGEHLDRNKVWQLRIGEATAVLKEASADHLSFLPIRLPTGPAAVTLSVAESGERSKDPSILMRITFRPRP